MAQKFKRGMLDPVSLVTTIVVLLMVVIVMGNVLPSVTNVFTDSNTTVGHGVGNLAGYSTAATVGQQLPVFEILVVLGAVAGVVLGALGLGHLS